MPTTDCVSTVSQSRKPLDGLLDVAHPHRLLGQLHERKEERELDWARVLKFINQQQFNNFRDWRKVTEILERIFGGPKMPRIVSEITSVVTVGC